MPLLPGKSNIGRNISELTNNGTRPRSHRQIVAIALSVSRKGNKKSKKRAGAIKNHLSKG